MSHEDAAATASPTSEGGSNDTRFFGQPWALTHIFGVELWERFSFYGMQIVLVYYLYFSVSEGGAGLPQATAVGIVGAYGGAVYLSTILGAWVADRLLGSERVLFFSAIVIVAGHVALAVLPGLLSVAVGLVLVALGSGGLKANATAVVGTLYADKDPRRDAGFSLFYLGINLGAFAGPLLTGFLRTSLGFHWAFGAAAVGMALGLAQYAVGRRSLPESARRVPNPLPPSRYPLVLGIGVAVVAAIALLIAVGVIRADNLSLVVVTVVIAATIAYFAVILTSSRITATERSRVYGFIPLFVASVAFWSLYQQQFTVVPLYAEKRLDLNLFGWQMPPDWVQSINPVFIIILSGVFAALWTRLGTKQPVTPIKFAAGVVVMGLAFLLFLPFAGGGASSTPLLAIVGILFVFTVAELLLSPVGLSAATKLAPAAFQTQMVALFFLSVSLGTAISGLLAPLYDPENEVPYFSVLGAIAIALGLALAAARKPVLALMRGVR
ncbi:peptide MFS transporter [Microbacterium sp. cf332]|uniref:peptide MFS transporter n=1 Tax=Microbacterium sp. cf332 TaxID=1761804 RepID=UPI00088CF0B6|nr:oligopeptide:H+ symporter [Microbacterium sp. cf332]SDQ66457.1 proton-dependent oligopeptide transporter, POT family [Microbacterium sp. cf332]